ncbi:hypothetical protein B2G71_00190 [Novosphingobium sp. PC22D]|uniref:creatininase family protein n=1 Tax=Novosphingobium sp. PC22D TaxID=1962403 RepID=UPI000BF180F3|nr:creatininase family protein [Novosphingobium sp. PC22D]PEQ14085.1 hypothetical protein B2G71_00190 [Novosphingobium sp. PC22D]
MAAPSPEVRISHLPGGRVRELLKDNPVILLPMGSHEDQGPHFPMGDYLLPERIAQLAATHAQQRGTPCFVMPVMPYGGDDYFRTALGGAVLSPATMEAVLGDIVGSLLDNGLTRIVMLNGHSGNVAPILNTIREVRRSRGIAVPSLYLWEAAFAMLPDILGPEEAASRAGHGADPLGSVGLHLMPELIDRSLMPDPRPIHADPILGLPSVNLGRVRVKDVEVTLWTDYAEIYNEGTSGGDPRRCDARTGAAITDRLVETVVELARLLTEKT